MPQKKKKEKKKKKKKQIQITTSTTSEEMRAKARGERAPKPVQKKPDKPKKTTIVLKKAKGFAPRPKVLLGKDAIIGDRGATIKKLQDKKTSKLYKMGTSEFRSWFKTKHGYDYPFRVPKEPMPKKKAKKKKK